jgi:hypothetical protein
MILAEQLQLLALDPDQGRYASTVNTRGLQRAAAAALVVELLLQRRLVGDVHGIQLADNLPAFNPLLGAAARHLLEFGRASPAEAVGRVAARMRALPKRLIKSLVSRDVVHDYRQAFIFHRYPVRSMQALREVFSHLQATAAGRAAKAQIALAALANGVGILTARLSEHERGEVRRALEQFAATAQGDDALLLALCNEAAES